MGTGGSQVGGPPGSSTQPVCALGREGALPQTPPHLTDRKDLQAPPRGSSCDSPSRGGSWGPFLLWEGSGVHSCKPAQRALTLHLWHLAPGTESLRDQEWGLPEPGGCTVQAAQTLNMPSRGSQAQGAECGSRVHTPGCAMGPATCPAVICILPHPLALGAGSSCSK